MITEKELAERINKWQGRDQPVTEEGMRALVWTMVIDTELFDLFQQRVTLDRIVFERDQAAEVGA